MVYITPGLFGHGPTPTHPVFAASTHAPTHSYMVDSQVTAGLGKRKRRVEGDIDMPSSKHISMSSFDVDRFGSSASRPSSTSEGHIRLYGDIPAPHETNIPRSFFRSPIFTSSERRPVKQLKRPNAKASLVKTPSHLMDIEPDLASSSPPVQKEDKPATTDLSPCHVCSTGPKRKRDLEAYMDCQRCTERTCYICARECLGCQKAICKECIVELGQDGDPWCLECYQHVNT